MIINTVSGGGGGDSPVFIRTTITIPTTGWTYDSSLKLYVKTISVQDLTSNDIVNLNIPVDQQEKAISCGLQSTTTSTASYYSIYAISIPSVPITCEQIIQKGGNS